MVRLIRVFDVQDSILYPFNSFSPWLALCRVCRCSCIDGLVIYFFYVLDMSVLYGGTRLNSQEQFYYYTFTQCRVVDPLD